VTDRDQSPPSAQGFPILTRPSTITDDAESFIADLAGLLRAIAAETGVARQAEPQRLFEAKEYRAAVISAMTLFEAKLRDRLNKLPWPQTQRALSMRFLVDRAVEQDVISRASRIRLPEWIQLRNVAVIRHCQLQKCRLAK
jgi:hypothetical protein